MKRIAINSIGVGDVFDRSLFLSSGQKLVPAGEVVTERHIQLMHRQSDSFLYEGNGGGSVPRGTGPVSSQSSQGDMSAKRERVRVRKQRVETCDAVVQRLTDGLSQRVLRVSAQHMEIWDTNRVSDEPWPSDAEIVAMHDRGVSKLARFHDRLDAGEQVDVSELDSILSGLIDLLLRHRERFTRIALCVPRRDDYVADHAYTACVFALAIGAQLTWGMDDVRRVGRAALLYDTGMMVVPERIRKGGEQLSDIDRGRIQRHTAYSAAVLESVQGIDDAIRLAAYQHHERENGTGYPCGSRDRDIGDIARVIAVADVYAAMSAPRNYRKDRLPYAAMEQLVRSAGAGQFYKPAVRALVQMAGLFPVGSCVQLCSGKLARVEAANPDHLDRPVIQPVTDSGESIGEPIDLKRLPKSQMNIGRPVPTPESMMPAA